MLAADFHTIVSIVLGCAIMFVVYAAAAQETWRW